jgi:hypothetical protein
MFSSLSSALVAHGSGGYRSGFVLVLADLSSRRIGDDTCEARECEIIASSHNSNTPGGYCYGLARGFPSLSGM